MTTLNVPDLSSYLAQIENMSEKELLDEIKKNITKGIEFFKSLYTDINNHSNLSSLCDILVTEGYEYAHKIDCALEIVHIITNSQTNRYVYENCFEYMIRLPTIIGQANDVKMVSVDIEIATSVELSQMKGELTNVSDVERDILINAYISSVDEKKRLSVNHKINIFNNFLNQCMLQLYQVKTKLKYVNLSNNHY